MLKIVSIYIFHVYFLLNKNRREAARINTTSFFDLVLLSPLLQVSSGVALLVMTRERKYLAGLPLP